MALPDGPEEMILDREVHYDNWFLHDGNLYFLTGERTHDAFDWRIEMLDIATRRLSLFYSDQNGNERIRPIMLSPMADWILVNSRSREEADLKLVENFR